MARRVTDPKHQRAILRFLRQLEADPIEIPGRDSLGDLAVAFITRFGRAWTYAPLPPDIPRGPENHCYANARTLACACWCSSLSYVEGVGHAWCVDSAGTVIDNTYPADLPNHEKYFGVALDIGAVLGVKVRVGSSEGVLQIIDRRFPWLMDDLPTVLDPRWHSPA